MRLFKQGLPHSLSALLLGPDGFRRQPEARGVDPVEPVRQALLEALSPDGQSLNPELSRRLRLLHDAQALWFARSEVVATLSKRHGEAEDRLDWNGAHGLSHGRAAREGRLRRAGHLCTG